MARDAKNITINLVPAISDEVRILVDELETILSAQYTTEQRHGLPLDQIFKPHIRFFVAKLEGELAGCGGVAFLDGFAEVKRMYVRQPVRGRGVAQALLDYIEENARKAGFGLLRLEAGNTSKAALTFYERSGFKLCAVFGDYAKMKPSAIDTSVFMEKRLKTLTD